VLHRGIIYKRFADAEATEKCFYVLATSLEALSANRRRRRDIEALLCDFHARDMCGGVMWSGRGRCLGCVGCVCGPTASRVVVFPETRENLNKLGSQTPRVSPESNTSPRVPPADARGTERCGGGGATSALSVREPARDQVENERLGGPRPPRGVASVYLRRLDQEHSRVSSLLCRRRCRCESISHEPNMPIHARMTLGHQQGLS
jgi:hypothetical protein